MSQQKLERLESDSIGKKYVPADAYYGVQTCVPTKIFILPVNPPIRR